MRIKRIVAREGLILLGIVLIGLGVYLTARHWNEDYLSQHRKTRTKVVQNMRYSLAGYEPYINMMSAGAGIAVFGYPSVCVVRFIIWSVRILRKK